ncbi:MAG TPA: RNA-binding protein [Nannocystis sp.]
MDTLDKWSESMPKRIWIGEMSVQTTEETMIERFGDFGTIEAAWIDKDSSGQSTGVGHVEYTTEQAGTDAINAMNGQYFDGSPQPITVCPWPPT